MNRNLKRVLSAFGWLVLGCVSIVIIHGCASIIKGSGPQSITIKSNPTSANVKVIDKRTNNEIGTGTTPYIVALKPSAGFFKGAKYKIRVEKEGCKSCEVELEARVSGWYLAGNFVFGGLIGWLIVDPATGAMWVLDPDEINADLPVEKVMGQTKQGLLVTLKSEVEAQAPGVLDRIEPVVQPRK